METMLLHLLGGLPRVARRVDEEGWAVVPLDHPRSIKDAVESLGVPHTEVAAIAVDGRGVDWEHRCRPDQVARVHDAAAPPPTGLSPRLVPRRPTPPRFLADVHLGTLARRLRVLGFDTAWDNHADDPDLARRSATQERILLSRDRGLLSRRLVTLGALVRHDDLAEQVDEVVARFRLADDLAPGTVCPACNGRLVAVDRADVLHRLEPGTRAAGYRDFRMCTACRRLYWSGAHADDLDAIVRRARATAQAPGGEAPDRGGPGG